MAGGVGVDVVVEVGRGAGFIFGGLEDFNVEAVGGEEGGVGGDVVGIGSAGGWGDGAAAGRGAASELEG